MDNRNIISLFLAAAGKHPHHPAFIQEKEEITYQQLEKSVKRGAEELRNKGIAPGDRVLVFIPMSITLYKTVLSLFYMGAIPVFIDQWVGIGRMNTCLKMVSCRALIAPAKFLLLGWLLEGFRSIKIKSTPPSSVFPHLVSQHAAKSETDTALITFTTGSTGAPKAADRTHGFLHAQHEALSSLVEGQYDRTVTLLPIVVLLNLAAGKTIILPASTAPKKGNAFHGYLKKLLTDSNADAIIGSPSALTGIANQGPGITLKHLITGGGPLFPQGATVIQENLAPQFAVAVYGSTEAEPISTIDIGQLAETRIDEVISKGLPVGEVHPDIELAILPFDFSAPIISGNEFEKIRQPRMTAGEIAVKGKHVLTTGYIDNQDAWIQTKIIVDREVWHRTGDAGRLDTPGRLFFLGRCTERITHNGQEIFPVILSYLLKLKCGLTEGAVMKKNNDLLVILEKKDKDKEEKVKYELAQLNYGLFRITYVSSIPKDPRHHTKTDYQKLARLFR